MNRTLARVVGAVFLAAVLPVAAGSKYFARHREHAVRGVGGLPTNSTANYFSQQIDHGNPALGNFGQRYFVETSFLGRDESVVPTVVLYVGYEAELSATPGNSVALLARNLSAALVGLEMRYFGASMPAPYTNTSMLRFLTVHNTIEDTAAFIPFIKKTLFPRHAPEAVRVVTAGVSYAGAIVAWLAVAHPALVTATWSSSGVVHTFYDYPQFDASVRSVLPADCAAAIAAGHADFDAAWSDPTFRRLAQTGFGIPDYFSPLDVQWGVVENVVLAVQYGVKGPFCNLLLSQPATVRPWLALARSVTALYGVGAIGNCFCSTACMANTSLASDWYNYGWLWLLCSQLGDFQVGYPGSLRPEALTDSFFVRQCRAVFHNATLSPIPYELNDRFGGFHPNATWVVATQFSDDPWQTAGAREPVPASYTLLRAQCDGCGHGADMNSPAATDPFPLTALRAQVFATIRAFLEGN